jgi:hypothetical protein
MNPSTKKRRSEKDKLIIHIDWARTIEFQYLQLAADQVCYSRKKE